MQESQKMSFPVPIRISALLAAALLLSAGSLMPCAARARRPRGARRPAAGAEIKKLSEERSGTLPTRDGLRLRLVTDFGSIRILTGNSEQVTYKVRMEMDSREPDAENLLRQYVLVARSTPTGVVLAGRAPRRNSQGRLWANYEVRVPSRYNLDVQTHAGDIETQDIDGGVVLNTSGGNITAGRIGGETARGPRAASSGLIAARLETQGGHINVRDVNGDLRATTAGGHITAGNVQGDAVLHSGGGHIRAGAIRGVAQIETGGGNIFVQRAGADVTVSTGGGQIDFEEAAGAIRARNGGGGIRVLRVAGPLQLKTGAGSIVLTKVQSSVQASTGSGAITAWFMPEGSGESSATPRTRKVYKLLGASQLESRQGDIEVYLPRELAVTIDATIEMPADHRIEADPSLPLKVSYFNSETGEKSLRGQCALNGGGEVLRLRTVASNIRLKLGDSVQEIRENQELREELRRSMYRQRQRIQEQLHQQIQEVEKQVQQLQAQPPKKFAGVEREFSRMEELQRRLEEMWWGGMRVDPGLQQRKLMQSMRPTYPDVARQAGIEGVVRLRVRVGKNGAVEGLKVLSGEPVLVNAALDAVQKWRYQQTIVDGQPVNVVTTVTVDFRLQ